MPKGGSKGNGKRGTFKNGYVMGWEKVSTRSGGGWVNFLMGQIGGGNTQMGTDARPEFVRDFLSRKRSKN